MHKLNSKTTADVIIIIINMLLFVQSTRHPFIFVINDIKHLNEIDIIIVSLETTISIC